MALLQTQTHLLLLSPSFTTNSNSNSNSNSNRFLFFSPIIRSEKASHSDSTPTKGKGFGSSSTKDKIIKQRASIIRRSPLQKPSPTIPSQQDNIAKEHNNNNNYETSFILAWLAFGAIILLEGIALAASGFLPEEWDKLFVKYLYPSFTPTVFLFFVGAVAYGVIKYLQNEKITDRK
ncbi:hypothetical protein Lal_00034778 [Lupinus albus]|nr:hypothetical protein Lal_00034778 [Lupinus albus]